MRLVHALSRRILLILLRCRLAQFVSQLDLAARRALAFMIIATMPHLRFHLHLSRATQRTLVRKRRNRTGVGVVVVFEELLIAIEVELYLRPAEVRLLRL